MLSPEARQRISAAQKRRWAKQKRGSGRSGQEIETMLKVKLLHADAHPPTVAHAGSDLGFDLYSIEDVVFRPASPSK